MFSDIGTIADLFTLSLGAPWWMLLILIALFVALSVFVYRFTIPVVNGAKRWLLTGLRVAALTLLLFLIFEPLFTISRVFSETPSIFLFIDDSRSMQLNEPGFSRKNTAKNFVIDAREKLSGIPLRFHKFAGAPKEFDSDTAQLNQSGSTTNFFAVFEALSSAQTPASAIVILSDGVQTAGSSPPNVAERLGLPVFTIGVGDSTPKRDIYCEKLITNENLFVNTTTTVVAGVVANGYPGSTAVVSLYEEGKLIDNKQVTLSDGIQEINFTWKPATPGEIKLSAMVSPLPGEFTTENNRVAKYVKVNAARLKVLILAGAPSPDVSFLANSISADTNIIVSSYVQVASNAFIPSEVPPSALDSASVVFLLGFPANLTPPALLRQVKTAIADRGKPVFIAITSQTDLNLLRTLQSEIPVNVLRSNGGDYPAQAAYPGDSPSHPVLRSGMDDALFWNGLPPLIRPNLEITVKPEAQLLLKSKVNNTVINSPTLAVRSFGGKRSIAVIGEGIWKWRLRGSGQNTGAFDRFTANSVRWLNSAGVKKQLLVRTSQKAYAQGERVEFYGEVYNESFEPVNDVPVTIQVSFAGSSSVVQLTSLGNGLYEGFFNPVGAGEYGWKADAEINGKKATPEIGRFSIGDADAELASPGPDVNFLRSLSTVTGGSFYYNNSYSELFTRLKDEVTRAPKQRSQQNDFPLWADTRLLVLLVLLLAAEWLLRKQSGML